MYAVAHLHVHNYTVLPPSMELEVISWGCDIQEIHVLEVTSSLCEGGGHVTIPEAT